MMGCLDGITDSVDMNLNKFQATMKEEETWHAAVHGSQRVRLDLATEQQQQHSDRCELLCHCGFDLHFPDD